MSTMFIISIPEKRFPKNSTNFQKILLENSKPNYCRDETFWWDISIGHYDGTFWCANKMSNTGIIWGYRLAGLVRVIPQGQSSGEIQRSSPSSTRTTLSFPTLLLKCTFYLKEIHLHLWLFSNPCGKVLIIVGISWSPDLRVQHILIER